MARTVSRAIVSLVTIWLLTGCAPARPAAPPDVALPTTTALVTQAPSVEPAATAGATETAPAALDYTQVVSAEGDLYILGNPDAPILLIDFSDFL